MNASLLDRLTALYADGHSRALDDLYSDWRAPVTARCAMPPC
jgi:hypothetical protein